MDTHFFLVRHGETQWNKNQKLQGQLDSPLTELGLRQAATVSQILSTMPIDLIISSPLKRAYSTAEIVQTQLQSQLRFQNTQHTLTTNIKLVERHFGDWQAQSIKDIQHHTDYQTVFFQVSELIPPNGESAIDCAKRFHQALVEIAQLNKGKHILLVSHGDIMRCFLTKYQLGFINSNQNPYTNGCIIPIRFDHQTQLFSANEIQIELSNQYA